MRQYYLCNLYHVIKEQENETIGFIKVVNFLQACRRRLNRKQIAVNGNSKLFSKKKKMYLLNIFAPKFDNNLTIRT